MQLGRVAHTQECVGAQQRVMRRSMLMLMQTAKATFLDHRSDNDVAHGYVLRAYAHDQYKVWRRVRVCSCVCVRVCVGGGGEPMANIMLRDGRFHAHDRAYDND